MLVAIGRHCTRKKKMELTEQGKPFRMALPSLLAATCSMDIDDTPLDHHQVKASYLFNLLRFIEWPSDVCRPDGSLNFGICGSFSLPGFYGLHGARVGNRAISVQRVRQEDVMKARTQNWHVLVISADATSRSAPLARGLLTVGETDWFTSYCGGMSLLMIGGRVRFQINEEVTQACGLTLNPRLLSLRMR
jgi:hypothetical protein